MPELKVTDFGRGGHGFWKGSARKLDGGQLTDIGGRALAARLCCAVGGAAVRRFVGGETATLSLLRRVPGGTLASERCGSRPALLRCTIEKRGDVAEDGG